MKKLALCALFVFATSILAFSNTENRLIASPMLGSCGATWGNITDPSQNGIGGITMNLEKFNIILNGWILDQTDVTDTGTGFYSFVIVNGCGTYRVMRAPGHGLTCEPARKGYTNEYVDTSSVFGDQNWTNCTF